MTTKIPDLTPPTKKDKPVKAEKAPKVEAAPADPNAPKKERAPRQDYGFAKDAKLEVVDAAAVKYRGQRLEWFTILQSCNGKTVADFLEAGKGRKTKKGTDDPPRGWLRFFAGDDAVKLIPLATPAAPTA